MYTYAHRTHTHCPRPHKNDQSLKSGSRVRLCLLENANFAHELLSEICEHKTIKILYH